jgi:flagellar biosynthesis protein FliR
MAHHNYLAVDSSTGMDPLWGHHNISRRVKVLLSLAMTWTLLPSLKPLTQIPDDWIACIALQLFIGIILGFAIRIILSAVNLAGQMISTQMGLSFATIFDAHNSQSSPVIGEWITWLIITLLWTTQSPIAVWMVLVESFQWIPIATSIDIGFSSKLIPPLIQMGTLMFQWGALLALPIVVQILFLNLCFGILNRLAPQLNLLSLSFPVTLLAGMILLWLTTPIWYELTPRWVNITLETLRATLISVTPHSR